MRKFFKLFLVSGAFLTTILLNHNHHQVKADEALIVESDFEFNVSYTLANINGEHDSYYTLSFELKSDAASKYEYPENIEYYWDVVDCEYEKTEDGSCTFKAIKDEKYVYAICIKVKYEQESQTFMRYLQNGREVKLINDQGKDNESNGINLPHVFLPLIAIFLASGYFIIFRSNKYVGSLETTEDKITRLLTKKEKFTKVIEDKKLKENKKKFKIKKMLFGMRGHLYSIRYIIENMSVENSIDNRELLDECNTVINNINAIDVKKLSLEELLNALRTIFDGDLSRLSILSKRMLITQKKYLEATYGKKK